MLSLDEWNPYSLYRRPIFSFSLCIYKNRRNKASLGVPLQISERRYQSHYNSNIETFKGGLQKC